MGGGLLRRFDRDTQRFAFKCSAQKRNGEWYDIYKDPIDKSKASKRGKQMLVLGANGLYRTVKKSHAYKDQLVTVHKYGEFVIDQQFQGIRYRAAVGV